MNHSPLPSPWFREFEKARFLERPNRFLIRCRTEEGERTAFLPNPGRLLELLLPGRTVFLVRDGWKRERAHPYTVIAVEREGLPIMLHTHRTNAVAAYLLETGRVPGLEGARVLAKEVPVGHSRFDLLVRHRGGELLIEVKSCTLFGKRLAMFPDAVTARGTRHLQELADLSDKGRPTGVLFVVHWPRAEFFLPDYHTDPLFARTMLAVKEKVRFFPVAVAWRKDLTLAPETRLLAIPWEILKREGADRGSYLLLLRLEEGKWIVVGRQGPQFFPAGYYVYVGSAAQGLTARLKRHRRLRKKRHWHIDYLRQEAQVKALLPIRASERLECSLAAALAKIAEWTVPGFGCSDCSCQSHLFGLRDDPLKHEAFIAMLLHFRMDRLFPSPLD